VADVNQIVEGARAIRGFLARPDILGDDAGPTMREIDALLARAAAGEDVDRELEAVLERHDATREWAKNFAAPAPLFRGYKSAPGTPGPAPARTRYVCPKCGRVWVRRQAGEDVPDCPIHLIARVLVA
jgi:hypothetical protein